MLARLDREDLIDDAKSLGTVLGMCIKLGQIARREGVLGKDEKRVRGAFYYVPDHLCDYVHTYSTRYGVAPKGPSDIKECIKNCRDVDLPASHLNKNDPWGFTAGLRRYRFEHSHGMAAVYCKRPGIGGDTFDITTWKSEDRAAKIAQRRASAERTHWMRMTSNVLRREWFGPSMAVLIVATVTKNADVLILQYALARTGLQDEDVRLTSDCCRQYSLPVSTCYFGHARYSCAIHCDRPLTLLKCLSHRCY